MFRAVEVVTDVQREQFCQVPGFSLAPAILSGQMPDAMWMILDGNSQLAARASLWWNQVPAHENHRLGVIGHYFANQGAAGAEVLNLACAGLKAKGCTFAVGPMDGNTWQRYRLITERGEEPPFFLEPDNPDDWPQHFTDQGFTPLAQYHSAVNSDLGAEDSRMPALVEKLAGQGIHVRTLRAEHFEEELRKIYALSLESFPGNFLYTPLGEPEFLEQYRAVQPYVRPELVFLAERDEELVGFFFAIPDLLQKQRGEPVDSVIAKTMAVHPAQRGSGLGSLLMAQCHQAAHCLGFRRVIHALMHESNDSRKISDHSARVFRRYTLFARPLQ